MVLTWLEVAAYVAVFLIAAVILLQIVTWILLPPQISLKGKHVVIVGGSSGIGLAIAELAVSEGAHVSIMARNLGRLEEAKAKLDRLASSAGAESPVFTHSVDVSDPTATKEATEAAVGQWGPINVLICSQGVSRPMRFDETPEENLHEEMNTNYWGSVNAIRAVLPSMKASGGPARIALVASQAGQVGVYGYAHYGATKFALRGLAEALQQELAPFNIRLALVYPPDTDTPQLVEENKTKHPVTKLISQSSTLVSAGAVALPAVRGIKAGLFTVPCNFEGAMLGIATAGMGPQPSPTMAVLEVLAMGAMRVVALATLVGWFGIIRKWHREHAT